MRLCVPCYTAAVQRDVETLRARGAEAPDRTEALIAALPERGEALTAHSPERESIALGLSPPLPIHDLALDEQWRDVDREP
jgi:hypothetical protein